MVHGAFRKGMGKGIPWMSKPTRRHGQKSYHEFYWLLSAGLVFAHNNAAWNFVPGMGQMGTAGKWPTRLVLICSDSTWLSIWTRWRSEGRSSIPHQLILSFYDAVGFGSNSFQLEIARNLNAACPPEGNSWQPQPWQLQVFCWTHSKLLPNQFSNRLRLVMRPLSWPPTGLQREYWCLRCQSQSRWIWWCWSVAAGWEKSHRVFVLFKSTIWNLLFVWWMGTRCD